jgi:Helix-turn-helix
MSVPIEEQRDDDIALLHMRLVQKLSYRDIGARVGLSGQRVHQRLAPWLKLVPPEATLVIAPLGDTGELAKGFGQRLEQAFKQAGFKSQRAFARHIGRSDGAVNRYLHGHRLPDGETMIVIAKALPNQIEWVLTGTYHDDVRF